jgi:hypothetical protein
VTYYYFVASLPSLVLGSPPPLRMDDFRAHADRLLAPPDAARVRALLAGDTAAAGGGLPERWAATEGQLRNATARTRAARLEMDAAPFLQAHAGFSQAIEMAVLDAYAKPNPLERELHLDRFRWSLLDEFARGEPFGMAAVLAYALKLRLCERWAALSDEAGRTRLKDAVAAVRAAVPVEAA